jgi:hypothetical protein
MRYSMFFPSKDVVLQTPILKFCLLFRSFSGLQGTRLIAARPN